MRSPRSTEQCSPIKKFNAFSFPPSRSQKTPLTRSSESALPKPFPNNIIGNNRVFKVAFWIDTIMIKISYAAIPTSPYVPYGSERDRGFLIFSFFPCTHSRYPCIQKLHNSNPKVAKTCLFLRIFKKIQAFFKKALDIFLQSAYNKYNFHFTWRK